MNAAPLAHFALLTAEEQRAAVRRLAAHGWSDHEIARTCGLNVQAVRAAIAEHAPAQRSEER